MRSRTRWLPPATTALPQLSLRQSTIPRLPREFVSAWIPPRHPQITTRLVSSPPTEFFDQNQWSEKNGVQASANAAARRRRLRHGETSCSIATPRKSGARLGPACALD